MSTDTKIKATQREKLGSIGARRLRREGQLPCNIQREGDHPHVDFSVDMAEFLRARRQHVHLFDFTIGSEDHSALVRELQWDAFGDNIIHVEFKRVVRGVRTETEVDLSFQGHPKAGVLNPIHTHVTVSCMPSEIPDVIEFNISGLSEGDDVRAKDLTLPTGIELALDPETLLAHISTASVVEEEADEEEDAGEEEGGVAPA